MKLIFLTIILALYFNLKVDSQKLREFQFPSPFQTLRPTIFTSESSHYLPPESQTSLPYFPIKNENKLPFQYLPPTGTKAPSMYPTANPMMISSPRQNSDDEDNYENGNNMIELHLNSPQPQNPVNRSNQTSIQQLNAHVQNREMRILPRTVYNEHPVDKIDIKYPSSERIEVTTLHPIQQTPATRRTIIAAETKRNDHIFDLDKSASMIAPQYMHPGFVMSSTTEPAIPIIRLSNEMDLDGSFSYEALGADQTHYIQHSRMENAGTDKEEQVVEGSYSYVGDNGQTYTVHYVADSNGFRASGDHLPVPPPIPEIIQRSIQYNLAAEAKKSPHMKSWNDDNNGQESMDSERNQDFTVLPVRNLFTGRTPEAFSYSFTPEDKAVNNIVGSTSSQAPFKTNIDFAKDQTRIKDNMGTIISPQVTFLASQGAHAPSTNLVQQSVAKLFTNEKTTMPQLLNYEAVLKEPFQENKPLWRWQYGYGNNFNQNSNKNTISRSEGDEVMVNFNDMTPEQYTNMINSQFTIDKTEKNTSEEENSAYDRIFYEKGYQETENLQNQPLDTEKELSTTTENSLNWLHSNNLYLRPIDTRLNSNKNVEIIRPIKNEDPNHKNHVTPNTPSEFYSDSLLDNYYELRKTNLRDNNAYFKKNTGTVNMGDLHNVSSTSGVSEIIPSTTTQIPKTVYNFETQNNRNNNINSLKFHEETDNKETTTTTNTSIEDIFEKNIFLKNLFRPTKEQEKNESKAIEETPQYQLKKINTELKPDRFLKPVNKKTTLDMSDILNYMTVKNHFESNKIKSKSKPKSYGNLNQNNEDILAPIQKNGDEEGLKYYSEDRNRFRTLNPQSSEELHGNIRNYKVLQRNNHSMNPDQGSSNQFRNYLNQQVNQFKQTQSQPPLGRAGPSMKSYLPPIYV